ncbi:hypothetical protein GF360_00725 [candidate division WWE3 bacterium]|nr:hypothetical protein [candidate division WWE3 bacterium]
MDNLLKLIFPPKCIVCGNYGSLFCTACIRESRKLRRHYQLPLEFENAKGDFVFDSEKTSHALNQRRQSTELPTSLNLFSYFVYEKRIRDCIRKAKYSKKQFAALREVTKHAVSDMLARNIKFQADYIIPIPLSTRKKHSRGFNQAKVIAEILGRAYKIPYQYSILTRQKTTTAQHRLNKRERLKNMKGAFKVVPGMAGLKKNKMRFLLVDDICTTGATLTEAAQTLYAAGAWEVSAFTLSKRLKRKTVTEVAG